MAYFKKLIMWVFCSTPRYFNLYWVYEDVIIVNVSEFQKEGCKTHADTEKTQDR